MKEVTVNEASAAPESCSKLSKTTRLYYLLRPLLPRRLQLQLRRSMLGRCVKDYTGVWPIDRRCSDKPPGWGGWPGSKQFALVLTHDVETRRGIERCSELLSIEKGMALRSSFNFVPLRYHVSAALRESIQRPGFEIGVHGLYHDGKLYKSSKVFAERAAQINRFLEQWSAVGFRSPSMHHNLSWLHLLHIEYDASTFDTDPCEPQPDGARTIFPMWIPADEGTGGYVELPYTLPQDSTLFVLLQHRDIDVWRAKLDWIVEAGGMALLNTHPDYMHFETGRPAYDEYPASLYEEFLQYLKTKYEKHIWHVLPRELAAYWRLQTLNIQKGSSGSEG